MYLADVSCLWHLCCKFSSWMMACGFGPVFVLLYVSSTSEAVNVRALFESKVSGELERLSSVFSEAEGILQRDCGNKCVEVLHKINATYRSMLQPHVNEHNAGKHFSDLVA